MNRQLILLLLLILVSKIYGQDNKTVIDLKLRNALFSDFSKSVYDQTGAKIFYNENWVKDIRISMDIDSISIDSAFCNALKGTQMHIVPWNNNFVLLKNANLVNKLPDYFQKESRSEFSERKVDMVTRTEERYLIGRKPGIKETIKIGKRGLAGTSIKSKIKGLIVSMESGEPIIGATLFIEETKTGSATDINGNLSISLKPGKYNAIINCIGFEDAKYQLEVYSDGGFTIELNKAIIPIQEVAVYADNKMKAISRDAGVERLTPKGIKEIPLLFCERDLIKVSLLLPGIVSVGEGSSGVNVRGGSSDQNAFYIDNIPIYNTSHLFGFFSAFNADIIKDFSIYKGYVPAQYGGRLSSVFNISTRSGNKKHFTTHGGVNPFTAYISAEGPLVKDKSSILISARSTYSDWALNKIKDPLIRESSAAFYDYTISANRDFNKDNLCLLFYNSNDKFQLSDINTYSYANLGTSLQWRHTFNQALTNNLSLVFSQYTFSTKDNLEKTLAFKHAYSIKHLELRNDISLDIGDNHQLEAGLSSILYTIDRGKVQPFNEESLRITTSLGKERGVENSIYLTEKYEVCSWLTTNLGLRYTLFTPIGEKQVYKYYPGSPTDNKYISDTITFKRLEPIKYYSSPQLRTSVNIKTDNNGSVKLSFNQMQQNLFMLTNTIAVAPNTQWKLSDYHIKPSKSNILSFGVFRNFPKTGLESSIELFYKNTFKIPEFKDGANFLSSPNIETAILQGKQTAYGVEFSLKRSAKKLEGWIAYTYSRSIVQVSSKYKWNTINEGKSYSANYDIPHVFNSTVSYHFTRRVTASSVFTYQSGRPVTYPLAIFYYNGSQYIDYSTRNKYRIPEYFRVDLSLSIEGNLKKDKLIHSTWMLSVYNLTGRKNAYSVFYKSENGGLNSYKYSVIGIPLFTVTWVFKFGNYAAD